MGVLPSGPTWNLFRIYAACSPTTYRWTAGSHSLLSVGICRGGRGRSGGGLPARQVREARTRPAIASGAIDCRRAANENVATVFRITVLLLTSLFWRLRRRLPPDVLARTCLTKADAVDIPADALARYLHPPDPATLAEIYTPAENSPRW